MALTLEQLEALVLAHIANTSNPHLSTMSLLGLLTTDNLVEGSTNLYFSTDPSCDSIQLSGGTGTQGTLSWNVEEETLDLIQNGAILQVGQELQAHCYNDTGATIPDGTVVMYAGTHEASGTLLIEPADTTDAKLIIGVTTEEITDSTAGKVTVFGKVRDVDTSSWTAEDILYVGASGTLTSTAPTTGLKLPVATVINSHAVNGTLFIRVTPINELETEHGEYAYNNAIMYDDYLMTAGNIGNPLLHLPLKNSLDMICGAGTVTFSRSSTATYVDRYGVVQSAAVDEARFEKEGLLIEDSSTNRLLYSEDFGNAVWVKTRCTVSTDVVDAPDENTTADKLIESTDTHNHNIKQIYASAPVGTYSASVFVKAAGRSKLMIKLNNATDSDLAEAYFDIDSGVVLSTYRGSADIKELVNGWYRTTVTGATTNAEDLSFLVYPADAAGNVSYTGDGTSGIYLWGGQLEDLPFASSYNPTTTSAVTRAADACSVTYAGNVPAKNTDEMSIILDVDALGAPQTIPGKPWVLSGEVNRALYFGVDSLVPRFYYGTSYASGSTLNTSTTYRLGCIFDLVNRSLFINGALVNSEEAEEITGSVTSFEIGYYWFGHLSNFRIYDRAFSEEEMKIL